MNVANSGTCAVRLFATPEENIPMTPSSLGIATLSSIPSSKVKKNSRLVFQRNFLILDNLIKVFRNNSKKIIIIIIIIGLHVK